MEFRGTPFPTSSAASAPISAEAIASELCRLQNDVRETVAATREVVTEVRSLNEKYDQMLQLMRQLLEETERTNQTQGKVLRGLGHLVQQSLTLKEESAKLREQVKRRADQEDHAAAEPE